MAKFSQQFLKSMSSPGLFEMGVANLGDKLGDMRLRQRQTRESENIQQILQANINNPAKLQQLAQEYQIKGNAAAAAAFQDAANRVTAKDTAGKDRGIQGGLMAITQAAMRGVPLSSAKEPDLREAVRSIVALGGTNEQITEAYEAGLSKPKDKFIVAGNRILNTETEEFVEPSEAAELLPLSTIKDAVTPESLVEYIKTGDKNVLKPIVDEDVNTGLVQDLQTTDNVLETVDKALGLTDEYWVVGYDIAKMLPLPTDARQMETYVQTLKSNLAFDRLQEMRNKSKTGGALGQVSNIELGLLQSSVAALDPGSKNFKEQLAQVRGQYENFRRSLLGVAPDSDRYMVDPDTNKIYYDFEGEYIDLEEAAKTDRFKLSPSPKTGGEI